MTKQLIIGSIIFINKTFRITIRERNEIQRECKVTKIVKYTGVTLNE